MTATGRWLQLAVGAGAGGLRPVRKLDKISQDIKRLVALRIDYRIFIVAVGRSAVRQIGICVRLDRQFPEKEPPFREESTTLCDASG